MHDDQWGSVPDDGAEWTRLDPAMIPFALDLAGVESIPASTPPDPPITTW